MFNKQSYLIYEKIYFTSIDSPNLHQFARKSEWWSENIIKSIR